MNFNQEVQEKIDQVYKRGKEASFGIDEIIRQIIDDFDVESLDIPERVTLSGYILQKLDRQERKELARLLLNEQILQQRKLLNQWSTITAQSSQIDTGYIAQHLVSLQTQIPGQGMRGKGDDLSDGSEVKSANFIGSKDKKGSVAPRWNFTSKNSEMMEKFLDYPDIYLLSVDKNLKGKIRIRIWKIRVRDHEKLTTRYREWMDKLGYPKFRQGNKDVNFQLFPPHSGTDENWARHGNNRPNGFSALQIDLEGHDYAQLIFRAIETENGFDIDVF